MTTETQGERTMIEIKNRWTGIVIYSSTTANTLGEAVLEAIRANANLSKANLSKAILSKAILSKADNLPPIEPMPSIRQQILKRVEAVPECLQMEQWHNHECKTIHCLGGWATTLHPQGKLLESLIGPNAAAALIFHVSLGEVPNFYGSNKQAMEWLRKESEAANATN